MHITYKVTRNGVVIRTGLTSAQLMASDYQDDPECEIAEVVAVEDSGAMATNSIAPANWASMLGSNIAIAAKLTMVGAITMARRGR